jgi:heat shock protein HslJ
MSKFRRLEGKYFVRKNIFTAILVIVASLSMLLVVACKPEATSTPTSSIQGILWQWMSVTNQTTNEKTAVPNPTNYIITFNDDGTITGKADCNNFSGTYSQENGFSIQIGVITQAFCGETSLDQQYLQLLGNVAAGGPDGTGNLALETAGGEQRMLFENGGAIR